MKESFALNPNEQIYADKLNVMIRVSKIRVVPGTLTITNQRVCIDQRSVFAMMFGLIGLLLQRFFPSNVEQYPISQIRSLQQTRFAINTEVIDMTLSSGEVRTLIVKPHLEAVKSAFNKIGLVVKPAASTEPMK